jgi:carboxypeptidase family protein
MFRLMRRLDNDVAALLLVLAALWSACSSRTWAQTGAGTVTGTVQDINKTVVPGADVTITQTETNISHHAQSNNVGIYYFGDLPRGPYKLVVEKQGFRTWEGTLTLEVGQNAVIDVALQVGDVKTVVEVTGVAPVIEKQGMEVADVKDARRIEQLPMDGRFVSNLFNLTPGVEGGASARVNGLKVGAMGITLDGVSQVDRFGGGMLRVEPGLDTIQEFRIETTGTDARFDEPAIVTLVTKSGTNQFHGDVFETYRSNFGGLQVRSRDNTSGASPSKLIRNEFGGSAGGPVYLPHLYDGRNRAFFFASYEGSRDHESNVVADRVPTDAMWRGDLSQEVDPCTGNPVTIYDPLTTDANGVRQPFPGNIIPPERISNFAKELASLTARPTDTSVNPDTFTPNFLHAYPDTTTFNYLTIKEDQKISDKDSLSVRFTRDTRNNVLEGGQFGDPVTPSAGFGTGQHNTKIYDVGITYVRNISSTLLSQTVLGVDRSNHHQGTLGDFTDWSDKLGLPNPFGSTGWPTLCAGFCYSWDADNKIQQALTNVTLDEIVTWVHGKHTLEFGGKARKEWNNVREIQQAQGSDSFCPGGWTALFCPQGQPGFTGGYAQVPFTGDGGFADMLLGLPDTLRNHYNHGYFYFRQTEGDLFVNDKWKATPRLTVDLGLRWEKWTPYTEKYGRITTVDVNSLFTPTSSGQFPYPFQVVLPGNTAITSVPGLPSNVLAKWEARGLTFASANSIGYPSNLFSPVNHDFGPRAGLAFAINNKTVLRGGYGEYFWPMPLSQILQAIRSNPPLDLRFTDHLDLKNADQNYTLVSVPAPTDYVGQATLDVSNFSIPSTAQEAFIWDGRHWRDSHARSWNATLEREIMPNTLLRFSYIGTHGLDLEQQNSINGQEAFINYVQRTGQPVPSHRDLLRVNQNWSLSELTHTGFSNTNSGQIEIERKFSKGIGLQWFYVYTRTLTTTDAGGFTSGGSDINAGSGGGKVPENINILGEPNLSYAQRLRLVYFNSTNIPPHRIRFNGIVDLPFGQGKRFGGNASGALNRLIGGWQIATIGDWHHGFWESISAGKWQFGNPRLSPDKRLTLDVNGTLQRLWFIGDFNTSNVTTVGGGDLNALIPAGQTSPPVGQYPNRVVRNLGPDCSGKYINKIAVMLANGNCFNAGTNGLYNWSPRGNIIGPGAWNDDLSLFKNITFKERYQVRFTADFFNAFNHPVDPDPAQIGASATGLQDLSIQANTPRTIQFSLRVKW